MLLKSPATWTFLQLNKKSNISNSSSRSNNSSSHNIIAIISGTKMSTFRCLWLIFLFMFSTIHTTSIYAKELNASTAFDDTWTTATDLENELQQKRSVNMYPPSASDLLNRMTIYGGWSAWSEWSMCSRPCNGGVMQQTRRCVSPNGCNGERMRYRICNTQSCREKIDFREKHCTALDMVPYAGKLYKWIPEYDAKEPCILACRGHLIDSERSHKPSGSDGDDQSVLVPMSLHVMDGERCRPPSLDMCVQGKCQRVGCDLKIGSTKKLDICGICGGNGSSCSPTLYQWELVPVSLCTVSCGGGYKMPRIVCRSRMTGSEVDDTLCNAANRPEPSVELCNTHTCPPRWIADNWSTCDRSCGPGMRSRMVVCAEENNGIKTRVADMLCPKPKPPMQEQCIITECPKWKVEKWSTCSESCGEGIQIRNVECSAADGGLSDKCDPLTKPASVQSCTTGLRCESDSVLNSRVSLKMDHKLLNAHDDDNLADDDDDVVDDDSDIDDYADDTFFGNQPVYLHHRMSRFHHEEPDGPQMMRLQSSGRYNSDEAMPSEPTYMKDPDWSPCSVTCGVGIRRRTYKCKIFLQFSRTLATINDTMCEGKKPHDEVERCVEEPCVMPSHGYEEPYHRDSIKVGVSEPGKTYVWREQGYTSCSGSCLGGVEELIINCVREDNGRVVSPFLCSPETKPEARIRTCNDRPCPPRWNYTEFTPCSKTCGIGIKTREVQCVHEVTRGGDNAMVVPNSMCPQPPPADRQYCNVLDCPVRWEVGEWSKCSHTCGYGIKERKVECKQVMAQEHKLERPEIMCASGKPPEKKPCNIRPCPAEEPKPVIEISNTTHIQHDPRKTKVTLNIGGAAVVFFGTQVKIKCHVKGYDRAKIKWNKDGKPLEKSKKFRVSKKGALHILNITFRDAGVYSCEAGPSSADITVDVKAKPGQRQEDLEQQQENMLPEGSGDDSMEAAEIMAPTNSTQTTRHKQQQSYARERNQRPKNDGKQQPNVDGSLTGDEAQDGELSQSNGSSSSSSSGSSSPHTKVWLLLPFLNGLASNLLQYFSNLMTFPMSFPRTYSSIFPTLSHTMKHLLRNL
ncbi:ADAMTS-like protein 1 isoform X2 [Musca domestica]|uniref:ADAMTS-like protein 1 isoform X2 n=1 Tax=Musca domestica TaxID=7370 RepID=A0ABM3V5Y3_MUSDO|nr:ADAMTS-like protein 1 isoform X2 [Musca domestica]